MKADLYRTEGKAITNFAAQLPSPQSGLAPIGVASYDNVQIKKIQEQLPSVEELKTRIRLLEEELRNKQSK